MKNLIAFILLLNSAIAAKAQLLYSKSYGDKNNPAIIYIHGGPRGNATLFEGTTAQKLADRGFYVIAYDRRGEGRSIDSTATLTFEEAFKDLNKLMLQYGLSRASIIGHSFGGIVATLYTQAFPQKVDRLILVGALFSQQETYNHIFNTVQKLATSKADTAMLHKIAATKLLNKQSAAYRKQCYEIAAAYGFFRMPHPTEHYKKLNDQYNQSEFGKDNIRNDKAPILFYQNERLVNIDTKPILRKIKAKGISLFAAYGKQDGIFSAKQLHDMKKLVGKNNFELIENCSHYPFVDQQEIFISSMEQFMKR